MHSDALYDLTSTDNQNSTVKTEAYASSPDSNSSQTETKSSCISKFPVENNQKLEPMSPEEQDYPKEHMKRGIETFTTQAPPSTQVATLNQMEIHSSFSRKNHSEFAGKNEFVNNEYSAKSAKFTFITICQSEVKLNDSETTSLRFIAEFCKILTTDSRHHKYRTLVINLFAKKLDKKFFKKTKFKKNGIQEFPTFFISETGSAKKPDSPHSTSSTWKWKEKKTKVF